MGSGPGYYLHVSFLLHVLGFCSLLAGYITPYWTLVTKSTGDSYSLGLVVSCFKTGCEMSHVAEAPAISVIVFGLSTSTVLLALFAVHVFGLAVCNARCRSKNLGHCLSYLSFLIAVLIGASQALYQVDVKREQKADVASVSPGWSRCSVIFSSGAFLLGAGLSLVDHVTRNRLQERTATKKTECLNKLVELNEKHRKAEATTPVVSQTSLEQISGSDKKHSMHDNQTPTPANIVMTTSSVTQRMEKRSNANPEPKLLLVSELLRRNSETRATAAIQGTQPQNMEHNNELRATSRSRFHKEEKPSRFRGREGMAAVADALRKHKMTNYGKVILSNGRQCLPSVEEETASVSGNERRFLERQAALDVDDPSSSRTSDRPDTNSFSTKDYVSVIKARKVEPNSKHIIVTESRDLSEWNNQRQNTREILNKSTPEKYPQDQRKRGNSVVENSVASVSRFMDKTVHGGHVFAENYLDTSGTGRCSLSEHSSLKCAHKPRWRRFIEESSKVRRNNRERFVVAERHVLQ